MQGRPRVFEGKGDKRVFDQEGYSYNIEPFEVPQKLTQRTLLRMSSSVEKDDHDDVKLSSVVEPHGNDVLLGRGGKNNRHSGNEQLRQMARQYREDYQIATKKGKSQLSRQLVHQVRELSPPGRFLKRNSETKAWDDVGDDAAREKGSQVLRDAVAGPTESSDGGHDSDRRVASDPLSGDRQASIQSAFAHTPSIQTTTSGSFPPHTPIASSSRKRHRYAAELSLPSYPAGDYRPYSVPYGSNSGYRSSRQRLEQYPGDYGYGYSPPPPQPQQQPQRQPQPQPPQVALFTTPQASIQGTAQITGSAEFDLFNCELLESDHEDQAEQFPPGPHEDTF